MSMRRSDRNRYHLLLHHFDNRHFCSPCSVGIRKEIFQRLTVFLGAAVSIVSAHNAKRIPSFLVTGVHFCSFSGQKLSITFSQRGSHRGRFCLSYLWMAMLRCLVQRSPSILVSNIHLRSLSNKQLRKQEREKGMVFDRLRRTFAILTYPECAAAYNGVRPFSSVASTSAPSSMSTWMWITIVVFVMRHGRAGVLLPRRSLNDRLQQPNAEASSRFCLLPSLSLRF